MSEQIKIDIHTKIAKLLEIKLKKCNVLKLNLSACTKFYNVIFETISGVFKNSRIEIDNESMNWLCQQYYDGIKINNTHQLDPNIFTKRASLKNIETKELTLLATILKGTDFSLSVFDEIKHRG